MGFEQCGPNEVLIVSGCCHGQDSRFILDGGVFIWPCFQQVQRFSLNELSLSIASLEAHSKNGIQVSIMATAKVKVPKQQADILYRAAQNFLGTPEEQIGNTLKDIIQAHQRAVIGAMSIEDINCDRKKFSDAVVEQASTDLLNMGFLICSYKVDDVVDVEGYLMAQNLNKEAAQPYIVH